ncbi:hypothetical protein HC928_02285 [bacterium]|nr:hypothetical protein [bacterium]
MTSPKEPAEQLEECAKACDPKARVLGNVTFGELLQLLEAFAWTDQCLKAALESQEKLALETKKLRKLLLKTARQRRYK